MKPATKKITLTLPAKARYILFSLMFLLFFIATLYILINSPA